MSINSSLVKLADKIDVDGKSTISPEYKNPNNSIEKSIERIADNYSGSGGGGGTGEGVLVVHSAYDETLDTEVLDKPWQEIHDAPFAIVQTETPVGTFKCPVTVVTSSGDEYVILSALITRDNLGEADISIAMYIASSANDYPVLNED